MPESQTGASAQRVSAPLPAAIPEPPSLEQAELPARPVMSKDGVALSGPSLEVFNALAAVSGQKFFDFNSAALEFLRYRERGIPKAYQSSMSVRFNDLLRDGEDPRVAYALTLGKVLENERSCRGAGSGARSGAEGALGRHPSRGHRRGTRSPD